MLTGRRAEEWTKKLKAAAKRPNLGGILVLLDGDAEKVERQDFCALYAARLLTERAKAAGAGASFSVAVVFACQEYESWILASLDALAGKPFSDGRPGVRAQSKAPQAELEKAPRDAKGELGKCMDAGYKQTIDQEPLTRLMVQDLSLVRKRMRSFRRLEQALTQLVNAVKNDAPIVSPS